ncbi:MAG: hypothetical protein ACP5RH_09750 [Leptodesmis sp.]|uniref:hypothetical protein n=1 Tax=Leptodesmis sp. TaxID=3100501 RepID=UPI003D0BC84F
MVEFSSQVQPDATTASETLVEPAIFRISPLIRVTLLSLYVALTLPLPFLPQLAGPTVPPQLLWVGIGLGAIALYGALSERVVLDEAGIQVIYPVWMAPIFRRGWSLSWSEVQALKPRSTGQGGLVYYFLSRSGEAFLLPMRVAGFARLVRLVEAKTGIDTTDVRPLSQPWMYLILLGFTLLLLLVDSWIIWTAFHLAPTTIATMFISNFQ